MTRRTSLRIIESVLGENLSMVTRKPPWRDEDRRAWRKEQEAEDGCRENAHTNGKSTLPPNQCPNRSAVVRQICGSLRITISARNCLPA